jgi:hypothetical protein
MSTLLIEYILREAIADVNVVEKMRRDLQRVHGVPRAKLKAIWTQAEQAAGGEVDKAYDIAYGEYKKLWDEVAKGGDTEPDEIEAGVEAETGIEAMPADAGQIEDPGRRTNVSHDGMVKVLRYLATIMPASGYGTREDHVRAVAARFGVNPAIYSSAGLGHIPTNPDDEDVWNTMDVSKQGQYKFNNSAWQPLYMEALEAVESLDQDQKDIISDLLSEAEPDDETIDQTIDPQQYGLKGGKERDWDTSTKTPSAMGGKMAWENAELSEDLMIITESGPEVIQAGTKIRILK